MKILVVDDSRAMRMIIIRSFRHLPDCNHEFVEAANGVEALERLGEHDDVELVVSDWNMPAMTGIELLDAVRAAGNPVRFGFITSEIRAAYREEAIGSGAAFVLTKPFTVDQLAEVLEDAA